jgi:hypothetical protein
MHEKSKRRARAINQENLLSGWGLALQENLLKQDTLGMNEYRTKFIINIITSLLLSRQPFPSALSLQDKITSFNILC